MQLFRRRSLDERLKDATTKLLERDLRTGMDLSDRQVMAVSWDSEIGGDTRVEIRFGPRIRQRVVDNSYQAIGPLG